MCHPSSRSHAALTAAILLLTALAGRAEARRGAEPSTLRGLGREVAALPTFEVTPADVDALLAEDAELAASGSKALRFADPRAVQISPETHGVWDRLPGGARLWRLVIHAPGATDLNLGFTRYRLPHGAELSVMNVAERYYEGPYTDADNADHGELWLPVTPGDRALVELRVPAVTKLEPELELGHIGVGYRDLFDRRIGYERQGSCNNDVACPEAGPWASEIAAVAVYQLQGFWTCTGTMIMDVPGSFTPYFLTAAHCGVDTGDDQTMVVYWNFESPSCGDLCCGSLADNQTGAIWRAARSDVDVSLVELEELPDPASGVYWAGWDARGTTAPQGSVGIHHPSTDEKAISFNTDPLTTQNSCIGGGTNTHWRVNNWEDGTTEPGSSGSGLWDPDTHLLVGFLSGGAPSCSVIDYDCYGKVAVAWDGSSPTSRLRDWLDPGGTGTLFVPGSFPGGAGVLASTGQTITDHCTDPASNVNGVLEPGEIGTIAVDLRAIGAEITGVAGMITTTSSDVVITDDSATWPDIPAGATATSHDPHFTIEVSPDAECLSVADFELTVTSEKAAPLITAFSLDIGQDVVPDDVPAGIPDQGSVTSVLDVGENVTITDLDVHVEVTHTWIGDLRVTLTSPANTTVTLLDRPGVPASSVGCEDDDMSVTFDDEAGFPTEDHCAGTTPWLSGPASPVTPLSALDGESTQGTWRLTISDNAGQDTGTLVSWMLISTPEIGALCTACTAVVAVGDAPAAGRSVLAQNRPNPFNPTTSIVFGNVTPGRVKLDVFAASGRLVRTLLDQALAPGTYEVTWDGRTASGREAASGLYFYRLTTGEERLVRRMSLLR